MVLSEACSDVGDVVGGVGVSDDDIVEIRGDALQTFDGLVDDLDKSTG